MCTIHGTPEAEEHPAYFLHLLGLNTTSSLSKPIAFIQKTDSSVLYTYQWFT